MGSEPAAQVIGSVLEGRYRVLSLIGRGGMGDVYLGEDTRLKRRCALKVLHANLAEDRINVERFLREAQMIASLEHHNIVDIYSFGEDPSGLVYFAMELLNGEDLDARLKHRAERPFGGHECCLWAIQIAQAVAVVHDAGLIHRDLKVSNIFLARRRDGEEICKLLDFGIARAEDNSELTRTGVALGTPSYMSPEQVRNVSIDRRSDIYSFGVLLFKLLTGRVPFTGEPIQVAMAHCSTPPPVPSTVAPDAGISAALDAIILKALEKDPCDRFQSMREVEAALVEVLRTEAPDLAPAPKSSRGSTRSNLEPRPSTSPLPTVAQPAALAAPTDSATPGSAPLQTGVTDAMPAPSSPSPGVPRRRLALGGALALGVVGVVALVLATGDDPPPAPAVEATTAEQPVAQAVPASLPEPTPERPPTDVEPSPPGVEPPAVESPPDIDEAQNLPPLEPELQPSTKSAGKPATKQPRPPPQPADPLKQIERKALKCRKAHKAVDGPKITIDYAIGIDGKVSRSVPSSHDDLGKCLAAAVESTQFEPKLVLGRKIAL